VTKFIFPTDRKTQLIFYLTSLRINLQPKWSKIRPRILHELTRILTKQKCQFIRLQSKVSVESQVS